MTEAYCAISKHWIAEIQEILDSEIQEILDTEIQEILDSEIREILDSEILEILDNSYTRLVQIVQIFEIADVQ